MSFLYALESIRHPVLDGFFSVITYFGSEWLFIAAAVAVFWCHNKRDGYYLLAAGLLGTVVPPPPPPTELGRRCSVCCHRRTASGVGTRSSARCFV